MIHKDSNKDNKIIIGLASILAGGGHNALRDYLYEELFNEKDLELHKFTHSNSTLDFINDSFLGRFPTIYDAIYNNVPNDFIAVTVIKLAKECEEFIKQVNPDVVISTNWGVCSAFGFIKKTLKLNFINVFTIPDYGKQSPIGFPKSRYLKPDYVFVFDKVSKDSLYKDLHFPKEKTFLSGYVAKRSFRKLIAENNKKTKIELINELKKAIPDIAIQQIDPKKRTIMVTGGAGGIINKSFGLLKKIVEFQKQNLDFKAKNQILIITGKNRAFYDKINKLRAKNENWANIIPLSWITPDIYSKVQMISDFPILITIAPATMNELLETNCGPFLIYHSRKGQEKDNIDFAVKHKLAYYIPKKNLALEKIVKGFNKHEKEKFEESSREYRQERLAQIATFPQEIRNIFTSNNLLIKRKKDKFRLKLSVDLNSISPRILFTIFALVLPKPIIFTYAQYFKQKHKLMGNRFVNSLVRFIGKLKPF